eukprot:1721360-Lingulodinium_polyedra.AAC.1
MASVVSGATGLSKKRRVSDAKVAAMASVLEAREAASAEKVLREKAIELLKKKDEKQLRAIISFMEGTSALPEEDLSFPRGVRFLGGTNASAMVPTYMVKQCLAEALHATEGEVAKMKATTTDLRQ